MRPFLSSLLFCAALIAPLNAQTPPPDLQLAQPMHFGGVLASPQGGSLTLTADGALVPDGGGLVPGLLPAHSEARFRVTGPPGRAFTLSLFPSSPVLEGPSQASLRLAEFHASLPGLKGVFDATGLAELRLGGRLDVPAGAPPGTYLAPFVKLQIQMSDGSGSAPMSLPFSIAVTLRAPLFLSCVEGMEFGSLLPGSETGIFEVLPQGGHQVATPNGPWLFKGSPRPATFQLVGPAGTSYSIQLPQAIQLMGNGRPIRVERFTCSTPLQGVLPPGGQTFSLGAGIVIPPDQAPGVYTGTFILTVNYQ